MKNTILNRVQQNSFSKTCFSFGVNGVNLNKSSNNKPKNGLPFHVFEFLEYH